MDNLIRYRIYISNQIIGDLQVLKQKPCFRSICREAAFLKSVIKTGKFCAAVFFQDFQTFLPDVFHNHIVIRNICQLSNNACIAFFSTISPDYPAFAPVVAGILSICEKKIACHVRRFPGGLGNLPDKPFQGLLLHKVFQHTALQRGK